METYISDHFSLRCNPIFIEAKKFPAIYSFCKSYGDKIIDAAYYEIIEYESLEYATAYFRGCIMKDHGFLEESRFSIEFPYYSLSKYQKLSQPLFISEVKIYKADGAQCSRCKDFIYMADGEDFVCRSCRENPYR